MSSAPRLAKPRWYLVPVRVLVVTAILTLLAFAVSLLIGIGGVIVGARLRGIPPDLTLAYRYVAIPLASLVCAVVAVSAIALEVRHFERAKALARLEEQAGRAENTR